MKKKIFALVLSIGILSTTSAFAFHGKTSDSKRINSGTIYASLEGTEEWGTASTEFDRNNLCAKATAYIEGCTGSYNVVKSSYNGGSNSNPSRACTSVDRVDVTEWHSSHSSTAEAWGDTNNIKGLLLRVK